jgi:hypothetical protein
VRLWILDHFDSTKDKALDRAQITE